MSKKAGKKGRIVKKAKCRMAVSSLHNSSRPDDIIIAAGTDKGKVRNNNEDSYIAQKIWGDHCVLAAAIDGLGGYEGGELAAKIAQEKIVEYLTESRHGERVELLRQAVTVANNAIVEASREDERYSQMGCVLTAAIIDVENHLVNMAHVGDSRLYSYHGGELVKLSHDHSLVGYREENGDLTEDQAMNHPNRNIVDRVLGQVEHLASENDFIESDTFPLSPQTTFLFCSDGLTDMVKTAVISEILSRNTSLEEKKDALIDAANFYGGKDNVTVVLVEYIAEEEKQSNQSEEQKNSTKKHVEKQENSHDEKNEDLPSTSSKAYWPLAIGLFVGLLIGFLSGYYVGLRQDDGIPPVVEASSQIPTAPAPDTLQEQVVVTTIVNTETDTLIP